MASSELAFTRSQLSQLPRDTLHELLKVSRAGRALGPMSRYNFVSTEGRGVLLGRDSGVLILAG